MTSSLALRGGRLAVSQYHIDPALLNAIGYACIGVATLITAILGRPAMRRFLSAFRDKSALLAERDAFARTAADATTRADSAEHAKDNWQSSAEAIEQRITSLDHEFTAFREESAAKDRRHDLLVSYTVALLDAIGKRDELATAAGVDLSPCPLPAMPGELTTSLTRKNGAIK
jgi:hypothetical protein